MEKVVHVKSELIYEFIRSIRDPEKDDDLESLNIVDEDCIQIKILNGFDLVEIELTPTSPNCSLAGIIGLSIRKKVEIEMKSYKTSLEQLSNKKLSRYKLEIFIKRGTHLTEMELNRQLNDKERYFAALENCDISKIVNKLIDN